MAELPSDDVAKQTEKKTEEPRKPDSVLGMELADLDTVEKKSMDVAGGVLVKRVTANPAKNAGVERGDVLLMFKGEDIKDLAHFNQLTKDIDKSKTYALLVLRDGSARFLALKAGTSD